MEKSTAASLAATLAARMWKLRVSAITGNANWLFRYSVIGESRELTTGMNVILKLSSFLLVCIGMQILGNGFSKLLSSLPHLVALVVLL